MTDAHYLTLALAGTWHGHYGTAPCPECQPDRRRDQRALSITGDRRTLLLTCDRLGCDIHGKLKAAGVTSHSLTDAVVASIARCTDRDRAVVVKRARQAGRLWKESLPIAGTPAKWYLRKVRAITCTLPPTLQFHPAVWHDPTARRHPAMVALVEGSGRRAVHLTYLRPDGSGRAAIEPNTAMLGSTAGGAARLTDGPGRLVVAEGIETALSLTCELIDGPITLRAALSISGLRDLQLPDEPGQLALALDSDEVGRSAANALAVRALALGWTVTHLPPPDGGDFIDIMIRKAVAR